VPKQIWIVLFMNTVFSSILAFSNIYINIFLWSQGKRLADIGIFNAFVFVFIFVGMVTGAYIMRWVNSRLTFVLSSTALAGVFLFFISQEENMVHYVIPLGALYGTSLGLYYSGFNLPITKTDNCLWEWNK
jgi:YQGE family putative transporter